MYEIAHFWSRVAVTTRNACWLWRAAIASSGYGAVQWRGATVGAHRVALELKLGRPVLNEMLACHTCHNRACCNPEHLYEGSRGDNARDMLDARRESQGEHHWNAKFSDEVCERARKLRADGHSAEALASQFGMSVRHMYRILAFERRPKPTHKRNTKC